MWQNILFVALGSALGGILRYGISVLTSSIRLSGNWSCGTLLVNLIGCFLIGILSGILPSTSTNTRLLLITGFCGGFTTFSTFSNENFTLLTERMYLPLLLNVTTNTIGGLFLVWLGYQISNSILR